MFPCEAPPFFRFANFESSREALLAAGFAEVKSQKVPMVWELVSWLRCQLPSVRWFHALNPFLFVGAQFLKAVSIKGSPPMLIGIAQM